jgi:glycosyltransferase involved in cell wall biosynthesis
MDTMHLEKLRRSDVFDPDWYLRTYPDVSMVGMGAAEHYLKYGGLLERDPGPEFSLQYFLSTRPRVMRADMHPFIFYLTRASAQTPDVRFVLQAAYDLSVCKGHEIAIQTALSDLPENLHHTVDILRANQALEAGNQTAWLAHLNGYITQFDIAPVTLQGAAGSVISRLSTAALPPVTTGPKITVIIPAWNAQDTIMPAAQSILDQTWQPLEVIVVDDASSDGTWAKLQSLAAADDRVRIIRNTVNVGPYVSKNIALRHATGAYVTGHDADDWAHPQRLERHMTEVQKSGGTLRASLTSMLRMQPNGAFGHFSTVGAFSADGIARVASISCLFEHRLLSEELGFWDSVRFGADSEMIARTRAVLGCDIPVLNQISMICLDLESSLTNHPEHGIRTTNGLSDTRKNYKDSWSRWIDQTLASEGAYLPFLQKKRRYDAAEIMAVSDADLKALSETHQTGLSHV